MAHDWKRCTALSARLAVASCDYDRPGALAPWNIRDAFGHVAGAFQNLGVPASIIAEQLRSVADAVEQVAEHKVEARRSQLRVVEDHP